MGDENRFEEMNEIYKQIRPGLYYAEYDDFDFDKAAEMTNERYRPRGPMCSGIRKGNCIGRNADVYAGFDTVLVLRLSRKCARYSSVGIVTDYFIPTLPDEIARREKGSTYRILPQLVGDGINEKGVSIMMFMIPNGEASENRSNSFFLPIQKLIVLLQLICKKHHSKMKPKYLSPVIKVVEFKVERGYNASNNGYSFEKNNETGDYLMIFNENDSPRNERFVRTDYTETFFN